MFGRPLLLLAISAAKNYDDDYDEYHCECDKGIQ